MDRGLDSSSPGEAGRPGEAGALPAFSGSLLPWQRFVLSEGLGARVRDLAQVLGQPAQAIQQLRSAGASIRPAATSAPGRGRSAGRFAELFALWHGRPPKDHEWPLPALRAKADDYEWLPPELTLLASLVGVLGPTEIAQMLTQRLRQVTGDATAKRSRVSVLNQIARLGLQTSDVLGGVTASAAERE